MWCFRAFQIEPAAIPATTIIAASTIANWRLCRGVSDIDVRSVRPTRQPPRGGPREAPRGLPRILLARRAPRPWKRRPRYRSRRCTCEQTAGWPLFGPEGQGRLLETCVHERLRDRVRERPCSPEARDRFSHGTSPASRTG